MQPFCSYRIDVHKRQWLESALGQQLQDNQQVIIRVVTLGTEPDADTRRASLAEASHIAVQGRANAAAQGVTEEEVDAAIEEATQHVRRHDDKSGR